MSLARLVVIEGPDAGRAFDVPMRGGAVGRGDGTLIQLTDPSVSRQHGMLELRDGALCWIEDGGRTRTLINGSPVTEHRLAAGDEIVLGATKLRYEPSAPVLVRASNATIELGSRQLLSLAASGDSGPRARNHLAMLAQLGEQLLTHIELGRERLARVVCDAGRAALDGERVTVLALKAGRRATVLASAGGDGPSVPPEVIAQLAQSRDVLTTELDGRAAIAAAVHGGGEPFAVLWIDRSGPAWHESDVLAAGCLANLAGAAWAAAEARELLVRRADALEEQLHGPLSESDFVGRSAAAARVIAFVTRVAPSDATVLLGGESGSGKEMVARAIHRASRRAKGPCVAVNCAALTESLIESELFGHEKGAFTGATEKKAGRFEMADRGTLFLDEVGELPLGLQTKFLRVLEERRFERVGGQKAIEVDVRVVAATNRDLAEMVRRGTFREDLYYRLSVIQVEVPPLRERLDDVPLLAEFFLGRFRHQAGRRVAGFAPDALAVMTRYAWPGNVRELRNAVERAVVLGDREYIVAEDLPPQLLAASAPPRMRPAPPTPSLGSNSVALPPMMTPVPAAPALPIALPMVTPPPLAPEVVIDPQPPAHLAARQPAARSLRDLEKQGILAALAATGGNKAQAALILEIDRSTLYKKLKDYDIDA